MKIAVLGMGHGGTTVAADLAAKGHDVTIASTSDGLHQEHHERVLRSKSIVIHEAGQPETVQLAGATTDLGEAIQGAEVVIVFVQTKFQQALIERMGPFLTKDQIVLFEPGYLVSAAMRDLVDERGVVVAEATSSPIDCRIIAPGEVSVSFRNVANHVAVYPEGKREFAMKKLDRLGFAWIVLDSVIESALHNPNLIVHTIGALMSIPRIENTGGDYWMYKEVFTPTVWNIVDALDGEKMRVLQALGLRPLSYVEACKQRNSEPDDRSAKEVFLEYAMNSSVKGPTVVDSRYITEDVPEGLVLLETLGEFTDVETPTCSALIDLAGAALKTDFRSVGRTADRLGRDGVMSLVGDSKKSRL